ncbi:MAG: type II toxin-antitoxin system HicB family antitoxin [Acidimicrobiia bacterium]
MLREGMVEMSRRTIQVVYDPEPDGSAWNVTVPELGNVFTWGRTVRQARGRAREAIAAMLDVNEDSFDTVDEVHAPAPAAKAVARVNEAKALVIDAKSDAQRSAVVAARALADAGLTLRDSAEVLGLSYQRVGQLLHDDRAGT